MSDDLVKRLRNGCIYDEAELSWCADVNEISTDALCIEAADSIVSLEVECDNLTLELKRTNAKLQKTLEELKGETK